MEPAPDVVFALENAAVCYRKAATLPWRGRRFWALEDLSVTVSRGETLGVIGRNGAGKSTLLRLLAGIYQADRGTVYRADLKMNVLSITTGLDNRLTGRQNIYLKGMIFGESRAAMAERERDIIELVDIGDFIDEPIRHYSNGMRARLGFAIAHHTPSDVLLIDETLSVGDHAFNEKVKGLLRERIKSGLTVVLVTHRPPTVRELCSRVIHIDRGRMLPELPVEESLERYQRSPRGMSRVNL